MNEFKLQNELLLKSFWGGYLCDKNKKLLHCNGYFNADQGDYGRGFIEFCIAKIFNIHRVPGYEQYYIKDGCQMNMFKEYCSLQRKDIDDACKEMKELYIFVQKELKESPYNHNGKIRLVRSLRPFEIDTATPQLRDTDNQKINIPVNIMTSYAHDNRLFGYGSSMSIQRDVEIEKIVMFDECLFHPTNVCENHIHGGEYEVWVMEDDMFGTIELDRECFIYRELEKKKENFFSSSYILNEKGVIDASLYTDERKIMRPCEYNKFTQWLIKKSRQKIEQLYGLDTRDAN